MYVLQSNRAVILGNARVRDHSVHTQAPHQPASIETAIFDGPALTLIAFAAPWVTTRFS